METTADSQRIVGLLVPSAAVESELLHTLIRIPLSGIARLLCFRINLLEFKLLLTTLLILSSLATLLQFLPSRLSLSPSLCLSNFSSLATPPPLLSPPPPSLSSPPPPPSVQEDEIRDGSMSMGIRIIKRAFYPYGAAAYSFIQMGTYRGGLNTFAVIGLASKPLHVYAKPRYLCEWVPHSNRSSSTTTLAYKILPDWGYGRVYTVVVVNCTFPEPVGVDGSGGRLILHASTRGGGDRDVDAIDKMEALREAPGSFNASIFTSPPPYDHLYCGSPLYGSLSPQRVREWMAYHVRLLGKKSHFIIYDAGGVHREVLEVLKPWMEKGFVTLHDVREQERFDGYYHNQFLVVNDCLHRYRFMAKWMFFFDVDEYLYVHPKNTIASILDSLSDYSQFTIEQMPMSNKLCLATDEGKTVSKWGFEKLVYRDVKRGTRRDRKYAVQARNVYATGVHMSQNVAGRTLHKTDRRLKYFHYHGTISERGEPCRQLVNATDLTFQGTPYVLETALRGAAKLVKRFEIQTIGTRLRRTRQ
ncbi:hypothetical protein HHK36_004617 [Tetracentron sinense]|uniref:Glycosyltransferase family 92 protein n=1 Tax=Tetracentron sinense TaxID=13715 RepID=A0A834ZJF7_TETSI|nr:hypothetical protein HHK36_004617 [Tetracentron sinense]